MSAPAIRPLLARRLVFLTGKGGVGKSTVAVALGRLAARRGLRTIVAEVSARGDVPRLLGARPAPPGEERAIGPRLHSIAIDPDRALEEYLREQLPGRLLADVLGASRTFAALAAATPGLRELLTAGKLWELAQTQRRTPGAERYDLVIVDAPATGHGLALLSAPHTFATAAQGGPIARQGRRLDQSFRDPQFTAIVGIATPDDGAVSELIVLRDAVAQRVAHPLAAVIVNRVRESRFDAAAATALRAVLGEPLGEAARGAVELALAEHAETAQEQSQLARLRERIEDPVHTLPLIRERALRRGEIDTLADVLGRSL